MHILSVVLFIFVGTFSYFIVSSAQLNCDTYCSIKAHLICPGIVIICNGENQEIRPYGPCGCCNGCFNISQVGGPCGSANPQFRCAKGLECVGDVCKNPPQLNCG